MIYNDKYHRSKFREMKEVLLQDYKELKTMYKVAERHGVAKVTIKKWFEFHEITSADKLN